MRLKESESWNSMGRNIGQSTELQQAINQKFFLLNDAIQAYKQHIYSLNKKRYN